jgi:hypothetical protein
MQNQQYSGLQTQQAAQQVQQARPQQELRFYKSGFFSFRSTVGKFQSDAAKMAEQGYQVKHFAFLGMNFWLQRVMAVTYER